jgi:hypothetical protein
MRPKIIAQPVVEPLTIDECRAHLEAQRYDDTTIDDADDAMIGGLLAAAREHCEQFLGLSLAPCTLEIALDRCLLWRLMAQPTSISRWGRCVRF